MLRIAVLLACVVVVPSSCLAQEWGRAPDTTLRRLASKTPDYSISGPPAETRALETQVGGTFAELSFETNYAVRALVVMTNTSAQEGASRLTLTGKNHSLRFENMDPDTKYRFDIYLMSSVPIKAGTKQTTFELRTLKRNVFVFLDRVHIFDDSDDLSEGEFLFNFMVGEEDANFNESGNSWDAFGTPLISRDSGEDFEFAGSGFQNVLKAFNVKGDSAKFAVSTREDDGGFIFDSLPLPMSRPDKYFGSFNEGSTEANSGFQIHNITGSGLTPGGKTPLVRESLNKDFELYVPPSAVSELSYSVFGSLVVFYSK